MNTLIGSPDTQALNFLISLATSGALPPSYLPATIAPPPFLALISTLTVHPTLTTRAKSADRTQASVLAGRYVRILLENVGPVRSNFTGAFRFNPGDASLRSTRRAGRRKTAEKSDNGSEVIENDLANKGSLWANAEDFWHVVGWALNCSVLHKRRWEVWRLWLEFMLDVLEADWELRRAEGKEALSQSLIVSFIRGAARTGGGKTRILRAIFADGQHRAANEFQEIWRNETKELKKTGNEKKMAEQKIDIGADDYGDYLDEENDADLEDESDGVKSHVTPKIKSSSKSTIAEASNGSSILGGMEAIHLRLRLLSILSHVCASILDCFTDTQMLYELQFEHIRPLPLPTFFLIMSPSGLRHFHLSVQSSLTQYILLTMIDPRAPQPPNDTLTQERLEKNYLPWPANMAGPRENAQVSLCVETLLRLLDRVNSLEGTDELIEAAERGINARREKCKGRGGRIQGSHKAKGEEMVWLEQNTERIRWVVRMAVARTKRDLEEDDNQKMNYEI